MDEQEFSSDFNQRYSLVAKRILKHVSKNSRAKITEIAKDLNISRRTAAIKLSNMEKELKIHYILELDEEKLGLNRPHLVLAKFDKKLEASKLREVLSKSHIPQMATLINGTYDLLIYANAMSGTEYAHWDRSTQMMLSSYRVEWHSSEVAHRQLGFFPLRNEIIAKASIKEKYKRMLSILNENSRISFQDLAKTLGMNVNTAVYNFNKILELGYIKSFTMTMEPPPYVSLMTFFGRYTNYEGFENAAIKARAAFKGDDELPLISRYLLTAPLIGSYDFFTLGAFDNFDIAYKKDIMYHKSAFKDFDVKMVYGDVKEVLLGRLPIRSTDTNKEYKTVVWSMD